MNSLNSILLEGNLTRDPEKRETGKGTSVCVMGIASNRYYKTDDGSEQEVSYFDVEAWARLADVCSEHLKKGRGIRVVGRLKQDRWEDKDGSKRSKVKIVAEHIEFKPSMKKSEEVEKVEPELEAVV